MTSIERGPGLSNVILGLASGAMVVIVTMFGFWEVHQEANRALDHSDVQLQISALSRTIEHVYELEEMQARQLSSLQEMEIANRRDIDRERNRQ